MSENKINKLYNLNKDNLNDLPFPILIQNNFLEELFFKKLNENFPEDIFNDLSSERSRKNIKFNSEKLSKVIKNNEEWSKFYSILTSDYFLLDILRVFENNLNNLKTQLNLSSIKFYEHIDLSEKKVNNFSSTIFVKKIYQKIRNKYLQMKNIRNLRIDLAIAQSEDNYYKTIHTDNRSKLVSGLFYFSDMEGDSDFKIYRQKNPGNILNNNDDLDKSKLELFKSINIIPNKLLLFLNTPNAFHSVDPVATNKKRNFVYFSIGFERGFDPWN